MTTSPSQNTISTSPSTTDISDETKDQIQDDIKPTIIHCRWQDCHLTFSDPEAIYAHLCDDHVGRKSTGNLCLDCKWVDCTFSCLNTKKRHHMTSHLIVHAPFKPHGCKLCKKSFKRPQDLKKHERTHQQRSTVQQMYTPQMMANTPYGYQPQPMVMTTGDGRFYTVSPAAPPTGMYPMQMQMAYPPVSYPSLPQHHHVPGAPHHGLYPVVHSAPQRNSQSTASLQVPSAPRDDSLSPRSTAAQPRSQSVTIPDNSYLSLAESGRSKSTSACSMDNDPNSYGYLAHGSSSNVAGVKREYDDVGGFFNDVRAKRLAPTYDQAMAQRLCATFGGETIIDPRWMSDDSSSSESGSPAMHSRPTQPSPTSSKAQNEPLDLQSTDVAQLNAFLLQLGSSAAAAAGDSSSFDGSSAESMTSGSSAASSPPSFDLSALQSYGLTDIPGFDESLLCAPLSSGEKHEHPHGHYAVHDFENYAVTLQPQDEIHTRPIASLPSRTSSRPAYAPLHPPSFDSIRTSRRDPALVPQLSPNDAVPHFSYRHVEPLTRASLSTHVSRKDEDLSGGVEKLSTIDSASPARSRSTSSASSSASTASPSSSSECSTCIADSESPPKSPSPSKTDLDLASLKLESLDLSPTHDGRAAPVVLKTDLRQAHIRLILDLLIAINRPKGSEKADGVLIDA